MEPTTPEALALDSHELQKLLVTELRKLEIAIVNLNDRVGKEESLLTNLEQDVKHLDSKHQQDGGDSASREGTLNFVEQQLQRIEVRMNTGERRLSNQEQAVQTISRVIQSMTSLVEEDRGSPGEVRSPGAENLPMQSQLFDVQGKTPASASTSLRMPLERGRQYASPQARLDEVRLVDGRGDRMSAMHMPQEVEQESPQPIQEFASLQTDGEQFSAGSVDHPNSCRPCSFYCFSKRGCKKGPACEYCHMLHISRSNQRKTAPTTNRLRTTTAFRRA